MATLKEFEEALRARGMTMALGVLDDLKKRDREKRSIAPARRIAGKKMTAELARQVLSLHATTGMTQQEIAFRLGVNQGRVNEVVKRGKWLDAASGGAEVAARDKAMERLKQRATARRAASPASPMRVARRVAPAERAAVPGATEAPARRPAIVPLQPQPPRIISAQLAFLDL